tara:strand:- start:11 stop:223 length:213 start_codon:yes stop_codon:yes gene_type:complete
LSIKKNPKSVLKDVKNGILIIFRKNNPLTDPRATNKNLLYKVTIDVFTLDSNNELKLLDEKCLGEIPVKE